MNLTSQFTTENKATYRIFLGRPLRSILTRMGCGELGWQIDELNAPSSLTVSLKSRKLKIEKLKEKKKKIKQNAIVPKLINEHVYLYQQ